MTRVRDLQMGVPETLQVYGILNVIRDKERDFHKRFAHLRLRGEWFRKAPELMAFIESIEKPKATL